MSFVRFSHRWSFVLLLCILTILLPDRSIGQSDPRQWGENGIPIRQGHHIEWQRASVRQSTAPNEDGAILVVWSDTRFGDRDIFAQMINPDGSVAWADGGLRVTDAISRQEDPEPRSVEDGWIIAWIDFRTDSTGDIWAQKLDMNGNELWDHNGVPVDTFSSMVVEVTVRAVHDGAGGAIIAWEDMRRGDAGDIYAQRINSSGGTVWANALAVTDVSGGQNGITADTDGAGNMVLAWNDERDPSNQNIYAAKIMGDGTLPWGENGMLVCGATGRQKSVKVTSDLVSNGLYCAWFDEREADNHNLYMQRVLGDGTIAWQENGIVLCDEADKQDGVRIAVSKTDGTQDGVVTVWEDVRVNGYVNEIYAQKTDTSGNHLWAENGEFVCGDAEPGGLGNTRDGARLTSDLAGGAIYTWDDTRDANGNILDYDLYCSRKNSNGGDLWGECGILTCEGSNEQSTGVLRTINGDVAVIIFDDKDRGSQTLRYRRLNVSDGTGIDPDCGPELVFGLDGDATEPIAIDMTMGRAAVVWKDGRGGNNGTALFYQVMDTTSGADPSNLHFELPLNGDTLAPDNEGFPRYDQSAHDLCPDGNQGSFISFVDLREGVKKIRLTRVDRNSEVVCSRAGEIVSDTDIDQQNAFVAPDGNGGCYVAWSGFDESFTLDIYVMHCDENCMPTWAEPVRLTSDGTVDDELRGIVASDGCCIVTWKTGGFGQFDVASARVCPDGTVSWNRMVCDEPRVQQDATIKADGSGGAYYAWSDDRTQAQGRDIWAQHISAEGNATWTENGILVVTAADDQKLPEIAPDTDGNLYVIWQDFRNGLNLDLYGQKLTPGGARLWTEAGMILCNLNGDQNEQDLQVEWDNGLYAAWTDGRGFYQAIYGTHINAEGNLTMDYWEEESGGEIVDFYQNQNQPTVCNDGHGAIFTAWVDWRSSGKEPLQNIWANWVNDYTVGITELPRATLPREYALGQNYPNPFNPSTRFEFSIPVTEQVEISIFNTLGRKVATLVNEVMVTGSYRVDFDATRLASGIYFYHLKTPSFQTARKMTLIR